MLQFHLALSFHPTDSYIYFLVLYRSDICTSLVVWSPPVATCRTGDVTEGIIHSHSHRESGRATRSPRGCRLVGGTHICWVACPMITSKATWTQNSVPRGCPALSFILFLVSIIGILMARSRPNSTAKDNPAASYPMARSVASTGAGHGGRRGARPPALPRYLNIQGEKIFLFLLKLVWHLW